jgi:hypothetical protein
MKVRHDVVVPSFKCFSKNSFSATWSNKLAVSFLLFVFYGLSSVAQAPEPAPNATTPVRMTVTVRLLDQSRRMPDVNREDVIVKQGNDRLQVTGWTPVRGQNVGLDLFILIDDAADTSLGSQLDDLRSFINRQAPTTSVGVGYMRNGTVQISQNFTTDHAQAAKALRVPMASSGAFGSPYLSVVDLMKRWPEHPNRRVIVMVTDGVDRARGGPRFRLATNPDVDTASDVAQRTGTIIHTIFTRGIGRLGGNFWEINRGQMGMAQLADQTGGESFYLGMQNAVSFKPYLEDVQRALDNQYLLEFKAIPGQRSELRSVNLTTEVAGVELDSADSVWVEAK